MPPKFRSTRCRNAADFRALHLSGSLIIREPEQLVLPERTSSCESELMPSQLSLRLVGEEVILRIHCVIAQKFEDVTVEAIGSRLGDCVHHRATELPVFCVKAIGDQAKFFDGIEIWNQTGSEVSSLADVAAVHQKCIGGLALPVDRNVPGVRDVSGDRTVATDRPSGCRR